MDLKKTIREIPDFPKKGILFYDVTTLFKDAKAFGFAVDKIAAHYKNGGKAFDKIVSMESRGFILGAVLAYKFGAGFVPVRKPGKLPAETISEKFEKEYGADSFEAHIDGVGKGDRVLIVDDLLATGGTCAATLNLVKKMGGKIADCCFLIELSFLNGREKLNGCEVFSLIKYDK